MTGLLDRWRGAAQPATPMPMAVGLQAWLDDEGTVQRLGGPLRTALAVPNSGARPLRDYLERNSWLVIEGLPGDWQGQPLDLDWHAAGGNTLHTRGWLMRQGEAWLLQVFDIGDLLRERHHDSRQQWQMRLGQALRDCDEQRLAQVTALQLQDLARHWRASALHLMLVDEAGWRCYATSDADWPWPRDERLQSWLTGLPGQPVLDAGVHPDLQALCGGVALCLLPLRQGAVCQAWLLCAGAESLPEVDEAVALLNALAEPLLSRLRLGQLRQQQRHLQALQRQLGAGGWAWSQQGHMELDEQLANTLGLPAQPSIAQWLAHLHPADREAAQLALEQVREGHGLSLTLRSLDDDAPGQVRWYHWSGQWQGQRLGGFALDISALKAQELQADAAKARLENLIASSPAVIYIQRYAEGALHSEFYSASLMPLLGWKADSELARQPGLAVHPDDRELWLQRTQALLRQGQVRSRYRLRDVHGGYHWVLDEARLLYDDLGLPQEVVGLWLDVSEATEAAERVRQSEERYRVLVEDSPAMICRYRPDLTLLFANQPLAEQLQDSPAQLLGQNLGQWLSASERAAFVQRLQSLTLDQPLSSAEVCLQLPGREHAWWVWAERGLFDEQGQLLEIQAVGRDNTEVRRSQRQLLQSAKMASLGELATGLVHEISQPLSVMRLALANAFTRLQNGTADLVYLGEKLQRIDSQIERASRLVDHLRVYGRRTEVEPQRFAAWTAVEGAVGLLEEGLRGKGVALRLCAPTSQAYVSGQQDQLEQVLINLMVNARDALLERGIAKPWIEVSQVIDEEGLCLQVEDNAGGIDPLLHARVFEPFFTTKPAGVGTGLGLSVSHGIVAAMGGSLDVGNGEAGACFQVRLPRA